MNSREVLWVTFTCTTMEKNAVKVFKDPGVSFFSRAFEGAGVALKTGYT